VTEPKARFERILQRVWSWLCNATVRYVGGVLLLFLGGVFGEVAGNLWLGDAAFAHGLVLGVSEAAIVSAVLTVLVDPFLKRRLQQESAWRGVFGLLAVDPPASFRKTFAELADCRVFFSETTWTLTFDWIDATTKEFLCLTMKVQSEGKNISREPHKLEGEAWVLASTANLPDRHSRYTRYAVSCPGHIAPIDLSEAEMTPHAKTNSDGSVSLDEWILSRRQSIPPGEPFEMTREAVMYRHANGHVPLQHGKFGDKLKIILQGDVRVLHPSMEGRKRSFERRRDASSRRNPDEKTFSPITPGQVTIVSWKVHTA
jgi:hypothetical protein